MFIKILSTIGLMIVAVPTVGTILGLGVGLKAEKFVYPLVLVLWGIIIYFIWLR